MKCVIISGGDEPDKKIICKFLKLSDFVIGVDGAANLFYRWSIVPDMIIGDFDTADPESITALEQKGAEVYRLPAEKNETDTEAAIDIAIQKGAEEIVMLGAMGGRIDHTLSNIMMMVRANIKGADCRIVDKTSELYISDSQIIISGKPGDTLSILPLTGELYVSASGLKYPLENLNLKWGSSRGISNIMLGSKAEINITGGHALIFRKFSKS